MSDSDFMTWLIIILVLALAIGPVLYILPSAKDKRLSALRLAARQQGFMVHLTSVVKLDPTAQERVSPGGVALTAKRSCAVYQMPMGSRLRDLEAFKVLRLPQSPTVPVHEVHEGWCLDPSVPELGWTQFVTRGNVPGLFERAKGLPDDVIGITVDPRFVGCLWGEGDTAEGEGLERISLFLKDFRENLKTAYAPDTAPE